MIILHGAPCLSSHSYVSLEQTADYTRPWRIPFEQKVLYHPDLAARARMQAGIRLAIHSNTQRLSGTIVPFEGAQNIDLYRAGRFTLPVTTKSTFAISSFSRIQPMQLFWR